MTLHSYNPPPMSLSSIKFLHLTVSEISPGQDFIGHGHYGKVKVKSKSHHDEAHLHLLTNVPTKYQLPTPYGFRDIARTRFYRSKVTMAKSKVKSWADHDVAYLHLLTNVPNKYQLPTPYGFQDIAWTRFYRSRSLWQRQIKVTPWRCTPTPPNQCPYEVSTSYTLRFPRYSPDKIL